MSRCSEHTCVTCADSADKCVIISLDGNDAAVKLEDGEIITVAIDLIPNARVGDSLLVHQGIAIAPLSSEEPAA